MSCGLFVRNESFMIMIVDDISVMGCTCVMLLTNINFLFSIAYMYLWYW